MVVTPSVFSYYIPKSGDTTGWPTPAQQTAPQLSKVFPLWFAQFFTTGTGEMVVQKSYNKFPWKWYVQMADDAPEVFGDYVLDALWDISIYQSSIITGQISASFIPNDFKKAVLDNFGYELTSIMITLSSKQHTLTFGCSGGIEFTTTWTATEAL